MNYLPIQTVKTYYVPCNRDRITIEVPYNYPEIKIDSLKIACPKCDNMLLVDALESELNYRSLYLLAKYEEQANYTVRV